LIAAAPHAGARRLSPLRAIRYCAELPVCGDDPATGPMSFRFDSMTPVVRAFAVSLTACLGAAGPAVSAARAASGVEVDTSVLNELGPAPSRDGGAPIVLKPLRPESGATDTKGAGDTKAARASKEVDTTASKATPRTEESTETPAERPSTVADTTTPTDVKREAEPVRKPAAPAGAETAARTAATAGGDALRIVFAKGSADLPGSADRVLAPLVKALAADPAALLAVEAYAEGGEAGKESARRLALSRGLAVRRYLEAHKIDGARAIIDAHGAEAGGGPADRVDLAVAKN
jgi:outer membrane protein OmpA-like peptidoglycan-associated protein